MLHVLRFKRAELDRLIGDINAAGYGLTFGLHTRIDETIARVVDRIEAGNIYVNRNIIGATVGVQPFGGARLSGTGPKAGGPLYLRAHRRARAVRAGRRRGPRGYCRLARLCRLAAPRARRSRPNGASALMTRSPLGARAELKGPVGERNIYMLRRRGPWRRSQRAKALSSSKSPRSWRPAMTRWSGRLAGRALSGLPADLAPRISRVEDPLSAPALAFALLEGDQAATTAALRKLAGRPGPIVRLQALSSARLAAGEDYNLADLVEECATATNTAAAGGNASLMTIG